MTDAAIESLELAQRIDPELNAFDRFALSLAYYLKRRYDESIEQSELNLRRNADARFNHVVLAAAHAAGRAARRKRRAPRRPCGAPIRPSMRQASATSSAIRATSRTCARGSRRPGSTCRPAPESRQQRAIVIGALELLFVDPCETISGPIDLPNRYSLPSLISQYSGLASRTSPRASATAQKFANCGA